MVDMFRGIHNINLDGKGRLAIPTKYRAAINDQSSGNMIITVDPGEKCLLLYPLSSWNDIEKQINDLPAFQKNSRRVQRLLVGHAEDIQMDKAGRILISQPLRSIAELSKKITMIGQGKKFEIWGNNIWENKISKWRTEETDESEESVLGGIRI
ncbi:MAG: division/cell wall cluster transcriptional repressor MraZ [Pseudomonadota bacterium]|nr:division/cell wall cluster transcriptional repressor MraZ [Pseudomonadota bacterium]MED5430250.1 division/cell wall cluster transcriptional repressor MraZ [Pseudomonadota bacterium]|tara:strand:+ start:126 stop:587 length:462 start_codon:yes stop_codon:yes gene_type:complete